MTDVNPALGVVPEPLKVSTELNIPAEAMTEPKPDAAKDVKPSESEPKSADPEAKPDDADKPKVNRTTAPERIAELTARNWQAKAEIASKDQEIAKLQKELSDLRQLPWDQLSPEQQQAAQLKHALKSDRLETAEAGKEAAEARAQQARDEAIFSKAQAAAERIPDFVDAWQTMLSNPLSPIGAEFLANSEKGAEVAYFLGKNPAEAHRIARLDPVNQGIEFARIEARLSAPQVRKVSQAPSPPSVLGGNTAPRAKTIEEMDMAEYAADYAKRAKGQR